MKKSTLTFIFFAVLVTAVNAKSWRVNNTPGVNADFTSLTVAQDSASSGDTLYIEGSPSSYGNFELKKKLNLIGPGYFLVENEITQASKQMAILGSTWIRSSAAGSQVTGVYFDGYLLNQASNVIITRNRVTDGSYGIGITWDTDNVHDVIVSQNYCFQINKNRNVRDILIFNNIVLNKIDMGNSSDGFTGVISNNVVNNYIQSPYAVVKNNIIYNSEGTGYPVLTGSTYNYNLSAGGAVPGGTGNVANVDMNKVFTDFVNKNEDNDFTLKEGSPASGAGLNGTDCGAFGGDQPYVLSGIPGVPHIYEAIIPTSASDDKGLKVYLKIKTNN